jgi:hypothetical protein
MLLAVFVHLHRCGTAAGQPIQSTHRQQTSRHMVTAAYMKHLQSQGPGYHPKMDSRGWSCGCFAPRWAVDVGCQAHATAVRMKRVSLESRIGIGSQVLTEQGTDKVHKGNARVLLNRSRLCTCTLLRLAPKYTDSGKDNVSEQMQLLMP